MVIELKTGKFQPEFAGELNDRSVRYTLGRSTSPMAVAAYTYDKLPTAEQQFLPDESHLVAALDWTEPKAVQSDSD
ncbi:hypothetical protein ACSBOX_19095 [Arthrobacter sp. KN11-1C]|uniref:hypothetical protein n=1 Tax=Arthrobacter sp. KN11-1C TaxID=3445774 RepID=UPI003F9FF4E9